MSEVTHDEKRACLEREIKMRRKVYPRWVENQKMTQALAGLGNRFRKWCDEAGLQRKSLHGPDAWDANPWVVAVSFTVDRRNIDAIPRQD